MRKLIKPSVSDPEKSVDLFDADRTNGGLAGRPQHEGMFCVAAAILPQEVDEYWNEYIRTHGTQAQDEPEPTPVRNLQAILDNWKKVFEGPAQEGAEAGFQHGLKKAYDDIMRAAEWD